MHLSSRNRADNQATADQPTDRSPVLTEEKLYPLAQVASELDCGVKDLRRRLNGKVVRDENLMRCIPGSIVRQLIEDRDAELAGQREAERQRRENPTPNPLRERVKAIQAAQKELPPNVDKFAPIHERARAAITAAEGIEFSHKPSPMDAYRGGDNLVYHKLERDG